MKKVNKRILFLDTLRGLAAIYVVLFHINYKTTKLTGFFIPHEVVAFFFIISGFSNYIAFKHLKSKTQSVLQFFLKRFFRLVTVTYIVLLIFFGLNQIFWHIDVGNVGSSILWYPFSPILIFLNYFDVFKLHNIFFINNISQTVTASPLYSLYMEYTFYFITPLFVYLFKNKNIKKITIYVWSGQGILYYFFFFILYFIIFYLYYKKISNYHYI